MGVLLRLNKGTVLLSLSCQLLHQSNVLFQIFRINAQLYNEYTVVTVANVFRSDKCYMIRLFTFKDLRKGSVLKQVVTPKSAPSAE